MSRNDDQLIRVVEYFLRTAGRLATHAGMDRRTREDWLVLRDAAAATELSLSGSGRHDSVATRISGFGPRSSSGAVEVVLTVTDNRVWLHGTDVDVTAEHTGVRPGLVNAIAEIGNARARLRRSAFARAELAGLASETGSYSVSLRRAGKLVADSFLPSPVSVALTQILADAVAAHLPVRLGIETGPFAGLPWETMPDPLTQRPLVLHPLVTVYRHIPAQPVRTIPGPLRILVAIAATDRGSGPGLDHERELRNVLSAVRGARERDAEVRIVEFATTVAIRAELARSPTHILHLSSHGKTGCLLLENDNGTAREVDAETFVAEAIPPGSMPPVISLASSHTDADTAAPSFAAALIAHGASAVIGTETSVTDRYATALFARVYQELTQNQFPDVVAAVADARRTIHQQLSTSTDPTDALLASMDEWNVVTVLAGNGAVSVYDPAVSESVPRLDTVRVPGLLTRGVGEFVGRRHEQRRLPAELAGNRYAGIVLHGIGGVGKTALAAHIVRRQRFAVVIAVVTGETTIDGVLSVVADTIRRHCLIDDGASRDPRVLRAANLASATTESWQNRLDALRAFVFDQLPVLVVLDNFDDNLTSTSTLSDPQLAALLSAWLADPGDSRLIVTSRYPFVLPDNAHHRLLSHQIGPLSRAETFKLIWALPALDRLTADELDRVWRLVGGHPRSLEYLDALLNNQIGRYHEITHRLENAITHNPVARPALTAHTLDTALATIVALIADDILLDQLLGRLTPAANRLLIGASVYREPVENNALLYQIGTHDPSAARQPDYRALRHTITAATAQHHTDLTPTAFDLDALPQHISDEIAPAVIADDTEPHPPISTDLDIDELVHELTSHNLLTIDPESGRVFVHRSTFSALERSLAHDQRDDIVAAHRRAAGYWVWRVAAWPQDRDADLHDRLEARFHYRQASNIAAAHDLTLAVCDRLHTIGAWDHEITLIHDTLRHLPAEAPERAHWLRQLGMIAQQRGDYEEAERRYQRALTIGEEQGNRAGVAAGHHQLGMIAQLRGDYEEAERRYQRALTIGEEQGNRAGVAAGHHQLGMIAQLRGDYEEAEHRYQRSLAAKKKLGDRAGIATSYGQLGALAQEQGDFTEAEHRYRRALTIKHELGDRAGIATSYGQLGALAQEQGDFTEAEQQCQRALTIKHELGDRVGIAAGYGQLGVLAQLRGDYTEAEYQYRRALALAGELGYRAGIAGIYHQFGALAQLRGDYTEAEYQYRRALTLAEALGYRAGIATTITSLGSLALQQDHLFEAVQWQIQAWRLHTEMALGAAAVLNLDALRQLRGGIGVELILEVAHQILDPAQARALEDLLDQ
ncbi:tetratricopeptide repeat protein [Nocardia mangyaensis]|uniref:tetratricopeptide repeat protein n=1 Tax=Nocardia mangyaensis TaxID=2213200 RepID=UPI00142F6E86|nr:tetratricopeptide repeat protein [Nocardia mangyaensis]